MAVASLVLGITSLVFCWWGLAARAQVVLAITFGIIGMRRTDAGARAQGMAVAGLVCGIVGAVAYLTLWRADARRRLHHLTGSCRGWYQVDRSLAPRSTPTGVNRAVGPGVP